MSTQMADWGFTNDGPMLPKVDFGPSSEPPKAEPLPPRLMKGMQADYEPAFYDAELAENCGLVPFGPNILIRMDKCATASAGGVILLDDLVERMDEASVTGCIYAMGDDAFRGQQSKPEIGQRVYIEKYSGIKARGKDGGLYRVVDEKCVACGIADDLCVAEV